MDASRPLPMLERPPCAAPSVLVRCLLCMPVCVVMVRPPQLKPNQGVVRPGSMLPTLAQVGALVERDGEVRRAMPPAWDILCKDGVREDLIDWVTKAVEREAGQCHSGHA